MKHIFNLILNAVPKNKIFYKIANRYVDCFNGDNNDDFRTNGENNLIYNVLKNTIDKKIVIFDVGANVGTWSKICLSINPNVEIHLFEPSISTFNILNHTVWPKNVHLNNFGLGEFDHYLSLNIFNNSTQNSVHNRKQLNEFLRTENIKIRKIDDYCTEKNIEHIDFLKIDVEGHELAVLKGACRMLKQSRISKIQFEYGGTNLDSGDHLQDVWELFSTYGYSLSKLFPNHLKKYEKYSRDLECFKYSNWVACIND